MVPNDYESKFPVLFASISRGSSSCWCCSWCHFGWFRGGAGDFWFVVGEFVCAGVALVGSIAAFVFLPDLESQEAPHPGEWPELEDA